MTEIVTYETETKTGKGLAPRPVERQLQLPDSPLLLLELNLPKDLVGELTGATVTVQVVPEEQARSRQLEEADEFPCLMMPDGTIWNAYRPARVTFTDDEDRAWQLPRYWLERRAEAPFIEPGGEALVFVEHLNLPTRWDLREVNITSLRVLRDGGSIVPVIVRRASGGIVEAFLREGDDIVWRLPANWRRRRVMLPDATSLKEQDVPERVAEKCGHQIVAVNYHAGSLCCLKAHYRFRDGEGGKWPVRIADCTLVGFGNEPEHRV